MSEQISKAELNNIVWKACDTFRGVVDAAAYKDYILTMLFVKYLSDLWKDKVDEFEKKYKGDKTKVKRALGRERFVMPDEASFDYLYDNRNANDLGEKINIALENIEEANKGKLENVFGDIDFNSSTLGETKERNAILKHLLDDFADEKLDLRPSRIGHADVIGDVYEYMIANFAAGAGKKAGEFYTPSEVSRLLAKLLSPKSGDKICDPTCGSGSLLMRVGKEVPDSNYFLAGQESIGSTWALCKMNMFLHGLDNAQIERGDTIRNPKLIEEDQLMKFNIVVANPPFSLDKWGTDEKGEISDKYNRFWRGVPPKSKGDYAFISHMIEVALVDEGKVGVIVPHGVLFRGGSEGKIRQQLIEENLLDAVIGLPSNLFFGTGIPTVIMIFNKGKKSKDVLFIDTSREFEAGKNQNKLTDKHIEKIVKTYNGRKMIDKYSYKAKFDEIEENEFNLNIPRYVDTFEEEEEIDIKAVQTEIDTLESELKDVRKKMGKYLKELEL